MEWKSNAKFNTPAESGTIYTLKSNPNIVIHKLHGYGDGYYLSVHSIRIEQADLKTEDFDTAVKNAQQIVSKTVDSIVENYGGFATYKGQNTIARY